MLEALLSSFFGWLPLGLWIPVWAVIAVSLLTLVIRIITIIADLVLRLIGAFT
ncbi:hypothetical protein [Butyricicoccus sp. Marseille-Q5471]|uniref:hypothetical protein n=1 Tax=Butyricicoccus sp. Marseille-Q5471 TaxID=3039493 RepID=UPI0024BC9B7F|nr:hypothetical protein [Butyricicoccus sp. Marseille-Q5471]